MTAPTQLSREQLSAFLGEMLLIRRFEEKVTERFRAGDLAGFLHASIGQEAVAVGVCRAMESGDVFGSTHRAHGHALANGTPANEVMAELYGKLEGCSHGYGGSMHLYDVERGNLGANAVVGGGLPVRPATRSRTCANGSRSTTNSGRISTLRLSASSTPRSHSPKPAPTRSRKTPSSTCTRRPRR